MIDCFEIDISSDSENNSSNSVANFEVYGSSIGCSINDIQNEVVLPYHPIIDISDDDDDDDLQLLYSLLNTIENDCSGCHDNSSSKNDVITANDCTKCKDCLLKVIEQFSNLSTFDHDYTNTALMIDQSLRCDRCNRSAMIDLSLPVVIKKEEVKEIIDHEPSLFVVSSSGLPRFPTPLPIFDEQFQSVKVEDQKNDLIFHHHDNVTTGKVVIDSIPPLPPLHPRPPPLSSNLKKYKHVTVDSLKEIPKSALFKKNLKCNICGEVVIDSDARVRHILEHFTADVDTSAQQQQQQQQINNINKLVFYCSICHQFIEGRQQFGAHRQSKHKATVDDENIGKPLKYYLCPRCSKVFICKSSMQAHLTACAVGKLPTTTNVDKSRPTSQQQHQRLMSAQINKEHQYYEKMPSRVLTLPPLFDCDLETTACFICGEAVVSKRGNLRTHLIDMHSIRSRQLVYNAGLDVCQEVEGFECAICHRWLRTYQSFKHHARQWHPVNNSSSQQQPTTTTSDDDDDDDFQEVSFVYTLSSSSDNAVVVDDDNFINISSSSVDNNVTSTIDDVIMTSSVNNNNKNYDVTGSSVLFEDAKVIRKILFDKCCRRPDEQTPFVPEKFEQVVLCDERFRGKSRGAIAASKFLASLSNQCWNRLLSAISPNKITSAFARKLRANKSEQAKLSFLSNSNRKRWRRKLTYTRVKKIRQRPPQKKTVGTGDIKNDDDVNSDVDDDDAIGVLMSCDSDGDDSDVMILSSDLTDDDDDDVMGSSIGNDNEDIGDVTSFSPGDGHIGNVDDTNIVTGRSNGGKIKGQQLSINKCKSCGKEFRFKILLQQHLKHCKCGGGGGEAESSNNNNRKKTYINNRNRSTGRFQKLGQIDNDVISSRKGSKKVQKKTSSSTLAAKNRNNVVKTTSSRNKTKLNLRNRTITAGKFQSKQKQRSGSRKSGGDGSKFERKSNVKNKNIISKNNKSNRINQLSAAGEKVETKSYNRNPQTGRFKKFEYILTIE